MHVSIMKMFFSFPYKIIIWLYAGGVVNDSQKRGKRNRQTRKRKEKMKIRSRELVENIEYRARCNEKSLGVT